MPGFRRRGFPCALLALAAALPLGAQTRAMSRAPLQAGEIDAIAQLVMLEDRRQFDSAAFTKHLAARHPEVRRRAAQSLGRVVDRSRGFAILRRRAGDPDTAVAATVVWAVGQLKDTATVRWLDSVLRHPATRPTVRTEAAIALGKVKSAAAGAALLRFLGSPLARTAPARGALGEAILSVGRITPRPDLAPLAPLAASPDADLRWRVAWTMIRARDPKSVGTLLRLVGDSSALVRSWAVRGLVFAVADSYAVAQGGARRPAAPPPPTRPGGFEDVTLHLDSTQTRALIVSRLVRLAADSDRAVRTEAIRALGTWAAALPEARRTVVAALDSPDMWIAVTAAEAVGAMRRPELSGDLFRATAQGRSCALRVVAMQQLQAIAPDSGLKAAYGVAFDPTAHCRATALQSIARAPQLRTDPRALQVIQALTTDVDPGIRLAALQATYAAADTVGIAARRATRDRLLASADPVIRAAALRSMAAWADTTDLPAMAKAYERAFTDSVPVAAAAAVAGMSGILRAGGPATAGADAFLARYPNPPASAVARQGAESAIPALRTRWPGAAPARTEADYRALVVRWVVPDYQGEPRPRARWETARGPIDLELFPGDAPLATEEFVRLTTSGAIVGTTFTRVVADFVDQMATIAGASRLRDEVNRRGLTRTNLAWATAGLDTGAPGYTLGHTPQPHNEGDFTALGRVVGSMHATDRIQLGDRITGARMLPARPRP